MESITSILESINSLNATGLEEKDLSKVIDDVIWAHEVGMGSLMSGWIVTKRLYEEIPDKAEAILARLKALSAMIRNGELDSWLLGDTSGVPPAIANKAIVSAAAVHPLTVVDGDIVFEKESFLRMILELAEPEGSRNN
jgi:hypothetical protein